MAVLIPMLSVVRDGYRGLMDNCVRFTEDHLAHLNVVYGTISLRTCRVFIVHCGIGVVLNPVHRVFIAHYGIWVVLNPVHRIFIAHCGILSTPRLG